MMKKMLMILVCLFFSVKANAGLITLDLSSDSVGLGEVIDVTVSGSGFSAFDTFNLEIEFDTGLFEFLPGSVGGDLFDYVDSGMGMFPLLFITSQSYGAAISFADLMDYVGGDFIIASFQLRALGLGTTGFDFANAMAASFFFGEANVALPEPMSASVAEAAEVSAPATLLLTAFALVMLMLRARKLA